MSPRRLSKCQLLRKAADNNLDNHKARATAAFTLGHLLISSSCSPLECPKPSILTKAPAIKSSKLAHSPGRAALRATGPRVAQHLPKHSTSYTTWPPGGDDAWDGLAHAPNWQQLPEESVITSNSSFYTTPAREAEQIVSSSFWLSCYTEVSSSPCSKWRPVGPSTCRI